MQKLSDIKDFYGTHNSISRTVLLWLSKIKSLKSKNYQKLKIALLEFLIISNHFLNHSTRKWYNGSKNFVRRFVRLDITTKGVHIICTHPQISLGRSSQGEWGGQGMWHAWERRERFWWESPKETDHSEDQGIDDRMGSEWILGRLAWGVWIGFE
jgi:hypothetical protein